LKRIAPAFLLAISVFTGSIALAQEADEAAELAKQLANPISSLVSLPFQYNYDENFGPGDNGSKSVLNIQPVIPFSLNEDWNLITRTIIPLADADGIPPGISASGLGDITASQFFSPKKATEKGWIWGVGFVELLPTATDETLGGGKWGLGPTAVVLRQRGPVTVGLLANHIWSVAGDDDRPDISATFLQPFVSYIFAKTKTTVGVSVESTYDWLDEQWSVPVILSVSQLLKKGNQLYQVSLGARYWAESPENGPEGWGLRASLTLLFPKK